MTLPLPYHRHHLLLPPVVVVVAAAAASLQNVVGVSKIADPDIAAATAVNQWKEFVVVVAAAA